MELNSVVVPTSAVLTGPRLTSMMETQRRGGCRALRWVWQEARLQLGLEVRAGSEKVESRGEDGTRRGML